jgi:hypothetical protein
MDNVPIRVNGSTSTAPNNGTSQDSGASKKQKKKMKLIGRIAAGVAVLLVLALAGWLVFRTSMASTIDGSRYQAVFFTNGQVYFGKLENLNGSYFKLTDIFYLQTPTDDDSKNPQNTSDQQNSDVQLVKLGSEIHGPEDEMIIGKEQVLFFENLKKDGKVSDSIAKYKSQKK